MTGKIPTGPIGLAAVIVVAIASLAIGAGAASASAGTVVYNNLNTVPSTVNGLVTGFPDQDTYSIAPFHFPFGGMVEFAARPGVIKSLTAQVDSFTCEHGSTVSKTASRRTPTRGSPTS